MKLKSILKSMNYTIVEEFHIYDELTEKHKFYDVYIPELNMLFESDGVYHHCKRYYDNISCWDDLSSYEKDHIVNDKHKNELALRKGFRLIRVWAGEEEFVWNEILI